MLDLLNAIGPYTWAFFILLILLTVGTQLFENTRIPIILIGALLILATTSSLVEMVLYKGVRVNLGDNGVRPSVLTASVVAVMLGVGIFSRRAEIVSAGQRRTLRDVTPSVNARWISFTIVAIILLLVGFTGLISSISLGSGKAGRGGEIAASATVQNGEMVLGSIERFLRK